MHTVKDSPWSEGYRHRVTKLLVIVVIAIFLLIFFASRRSAGGYSRYRQLSMDLQAVALVTEQASAELNGGKLIACNETDIGAMIRRDRPGLYGVPRSVLLQVEDSLAAGLRFHVNPKLVNVAFRDTPEDEPMIILDYPPDAHSVDGKIIGINSDYQLVAEK